MHSDQLNTFKPLYARRPTEHICIYTATSSINQKKNFSKYMRSWRVHVNFSTCKAELTRSRVIRNLAATACQIIQPPYALIAAVIFRAPSEPTSVSEATSTAPTPTPRPTPTSVSEAASTAPTPTPRPTPRPTPTSSIRGNINRSVWGNINRFVPGNINRSVQGNINRSVRGNINRFEADTRKGKTGTV